MSKRRNHLNAYIEGWRNQNPARVLAALAEGFVFDDPALPEPVTKAGMADYMASWEARTRALSGAWRYEDSHEILEDRDGVLLRWKWWRFTGSDLQGSALTKTGDQGMLFERITYYSARPAAAGARPAEARPERQAAGEPGTGRAGLADLAGLVVRDEEMDWQAWGAGSEKTGQPRYKTFIDGGTTPTGGLIQGVLEYPPGGRSPAHWHTPAETYYVLSGSGSARIDGRALSFGPGDTLFVPGGAVHSFENTGAETLRVLWTLNCDSVEAIDFHYLD